MRDIPRPVGGLYVRIVKEMLNSSVWVGSSKDQKILWVTMLCMADLGGHVWAAVPGLAKAAELTIEETELALEALMAPDKHSRTPEMDGRRIVKIDGGWRIVTYEKYKSMQTPKQAKWAADKRRQREDTDGNQVDIRGHFECPKDTEDTNGDLLSSEISSEISPAEEEDLTVNAREEYDLLGDIARSYADGIAEAAGAPWRLPDANNEAQVILDAVSLHQPGLRGKQLLSWVRHSAVTYRRTMADSWQFQRGFRPSKWMEWLNAGGERAPRRTVGSTGQPGEIPRQRHNVQYEWMTNPNKVVIR